MRCSPCSTTSASPRSPSPPSTSSCSNRRATAASRHSWTRRTHRRADRPTAAMDRPSPPPDADPEPVGHPTGPGAERSEEQLLAAVRAGDRPAYAELWSRLEPDARRYAQRYVGAGDVEDVVSEAFAKMLRALQNGRGPTESPLQYLLVAARTTAFSLTKANARSADSASRYGATEPALVVFAVDADERLIEAFRALPPRWRNVLWWG